jgi:hypothetical protein
MSLRRLQKKSFFLCILYDISMQFLVYFITKAWIWIIQTFKNWVLCDLFSPHFANDHHERAKLMMNNANKSQKKSFFCLSTRFFAFTILPFKHLKSILPAWLVIRIFLNAKKNQQQRKEKGLLVSFFKFHFTLHRLL